MSNQITVPKRMIRTLFLTTMLIMLAGSGMIRAQVPDCLDVSPDSLHFFANMSDPYYGTNYADTQTIYVDACEENVHWDINPGESWIGVDYRSGMGTSSFKVWIVWSGLPDIFTPPPANDTIILNGNVIIEALEIPDSIHFVHISMEMYWEGDSLALVVEPSSLEFSAGVDEIIEGTVHVSESHGEEILFEYHSNANWLIVPQYFAPLYTPSDAIFNINTAGLTPGYYNTNLVFQAFGDEGGQPASVVYVPVYLTVADTNYYVETAPAIIEKSIPVGSADYDSIYVYDILGRNVPFHFSNLSDWLTVEPYAEPPYETPLSLSLLFGTENLDPGIYYDTVTIEPASEEMPFETRYVHISINVYDNPVINVSPESFYYELEQGEILNYELYWVFEEHGEHINFTNRNLNQSGWLLLPERSVWTTPDSIPFAISTAGIDPGSYTDSIMILPYDSPDMFDTVFIPLQLEVTLPSEPRVVAEPNHFELSVNEGESINDLSIYVYDMAGEELPYAAETFYCSTWVVVHPLVDQYLPATIGFDILSAFLAPGTYTDTILVFNPLDDGSFYFEVKVPVILHVNETGGETAIVHSIPDHFEFTSTPDGAMITDSFYVYEEHGRTVLFGAENMDHSQHWLYVSGSGEYIVFETPQQLMFFVHPSGLEPGYYSDTILIYDPEDTVFENVKVPVNLYIHDGELICGDVNGDGIVNLSDILYLISYLYILPPGPPPLPMAAGYITEDDQINLEDILHLIDFVYGVPKGAPPVCPGFPE